MTTRRFRVTVDGRAYEVEIEEVGAAAARPAPAPVARPRPQPAPPRRVPAPASPARVAPARAAGPQAAAKGRAPAVTLPPGAQGVIAPLPGVILDVRTEPGQAVQAGQVLFILEAMKMENEITAPASGTVQQVGVAKGASVGVGDLLAVIAK